MVRTMFHLATFTALLAFTAATALARCEITVAADGTGNVKTVNQAIERVPSGNKARCIIRIRPGTYQEQIRVPADKPYISFIGEDAKTTVLTFKISNKEAGSTSAAYATYIGGHDFHAENITFENSFGAGSQAVAVLVEADRAVFKNCRFLGWQDTLYVKNGRQYFKDSYIEGHVDFIFGQAAAVFENCHIHSKADGYIAAPMRFSETEPAGLIFNGCLLTSSDTVKGVYLGRPWRDFGRAVFINTRMDAHIRPEGWHHWEPHREKTAFMAEHGTIGSGVSQVRASWARKLSERELATFSTQNFLKGRDGWSPGVATADWLKTNKPDFKVVSWGEVLRQPPHWYAVDEATRIANQVLFYQRDIGGWEKNVDMAAMLTQAERQKLSSSKASTDTTIDNGATTMQLRFLAKVIKAKNIEAHRIGFIKGLDFLLSMQYENGGFPQYFPLRKDYSRHITFNDNAMVNVLRLLRDVAKGEEDLLFVDESRREKAALAVQRAVPLILRTQVAVNGKKTVWAAQYDEKTLSPAAARAFEPISLSAGESVGIVRFLMLDLVPSDEIVRAVDSAVEWYRANQITGSRWERKNGENVLVQDKNAPPIWARFYQIGTMRPIFIGRDGVIKFDVMQIEAERRNGYSWFVDSPNELLDEYRKWKAKIGPR
ncbi:MAG TPA: pectate lyase [Pyrinomonadaceae bacterium]|nr:pectate lyase [Pyrinomonadaceae bacterium]